MRAGVVLLQWRCAVMCEVLHGAHVCVCAACGAHRWFSYHVCAPLRASGVLQKQGVAAFVAGDFTGAINWFTKAITASPEDFKLYSNRSAAYVAMANSAVRFCLPDVSVPSVPAACLCQAMCGPLHRHSFGVGGCLLTPSVCICRVACMWCVLQSYRAALADGEKCSELAPDWAKGFYRQGVALKGLGRIADAKAAFQRAKALDPTDAAITTAVAEIAKMKVTDVMVDEADDGGDKDKFDLLEEWLRTPVEGDTSVAEFPLLYMKRYSENNRGVHCRVSIPVRGGALCA